MVTFTEEDFAGFTRILSSADLQALEKAEKELEKRGFNIQDKKNALTLLRAFDQAKHIPITFETLIRTVETYRDSFDWLSPVELEYRKFVERLGPDQTATIEGFIDRRRFIRDGEERLETFNCLANYMLATGHQISTLNLDNAIGNIQNSPHGRYGYLRFAQTPDQLRRQKELEAKANTPVTKVEKDPDAAMPEASDYPGVVRPLSGRLKQWKENQDRPSPVIQHDPTPDTPTYWQRRVHEFLVNIPENNIRTELEPQFSTAKNGNWEVTYRILENTYNRRKTERIVSSRTI